MLDCFTVARLAHPATALWRTCSDWVQSLAPDGRSLLTQAGDDTISTFVLRDLRGRPLASYGGVEQVEDWESASAVVFRDYVGTGSTYYLVRCVGTACERASDLLHD